ncbi:MAG: sigma 54-interacting transcriptional regulator [Deltaproteobacteria bacterium]|nr:sigma 54-interacting transcriptional regulator [Deltaproteobacteria bacterium]
MDKINKNNEPEATSPEELTTLYEVAKAVSATLDLRQALYDVLDILDRRMDMHHGMVTLISPDEDLVQVEVAHGMSVHAARRGQYKLGEGITGRVVETGEPMVVPHISEEPLFLDKTHVRRQRPDEDTSFLCVPIKSGTKVIGTISADRIFQGETALGADLRFLTIIASLIARIAVNLGTLNREKERLRRENLRLTQALADKYATTNIIGNSNKMREVFHLIEQVSGSTATVLIRGESGTGKELVASAIHYNSPRAKGPFIKVNCSALPSSLMESELFGHVQGAFTGAVKDKPGRFELANQGTLFLDEIGSVPIEVQAKLLRVLQEREIERVGGIKPRKVDVRIITATNRNLEQAMEQGEFREDLYWRLNVFPIFLPPLRERPTDILLLADHFVEHYAQRHQKDVRRLSTPALDALTSYHWPGNVRELENCIERAVLLSTEAVIHAYHLPPSLQTAEASATEISTSLDKAIAKVEKDLITDALKSSQGNMAKAARILQSTERVIRYKVKKYGLSPRRFR